MPEFSLIRWENILALHAVFTAADVRLSHVPLLLHLSPFPTCGVLLSLGSHTLPSKLTFIVSEAVFSLSLVQLHVPC